MSSSEKFTAYITPFAAAIKKTPEEVAEALKSLIEEPSDEAVDLLKDEKYTSFEDIRAAFPTVGLAKLKKAVADHLRAKPEPVATPTPTQAAPVASGPAFDVLPTLLDDATWLAALQTGGTLNVDQATIIAAVRAGLATRVNFFKVLDALKEAIEHHAETLQEPHDDGYFELLDLITSRSYGDLFAALKVKGSYVTEARRKELMKRLDTILWPALLDFQNVLRNYVDVWQKGSMSNPANMMMIFAQMSGGPRTMPPGTMQPPDPSSIRDAALSFNQQINRVFSGFGVVVTRALAYEAQRIKELLNDDKLPARTGSPNRDFMLKSLKVDLTPDYIRLERNLTKYVLAVLEYTKLAAGEHEFGYIGSLYMLGSQINWDKLTESPQRSGSDSRRGDPGSWHR